VVGAFWGDCGLAWVDPRGGALKREEVGAAEDVGGFVEVVSWGLLSEGKRLFVGAVDAEAEVPELAVGWVEKEKAPEEGFGDVIVGPEEAAVAEGLLRLNTEDVEALPNIDVPVDGAAAAVVGGWPKGFDLVASLSGDLFAPPNKLPVDWVLSVLPKIFVVDVGFDAGSKILGATVDAVAADPLIPGAED